MNQYTLSAVKNDATLIKGIQNHSINPGLAQLISSGSGAVDPTFVSVGQIQPELTFDTLVIKTALAGLGGISGEALANYTFFFQKMLDGGLRGGAASHIKVVAAAGIIVPTQIRAAQGGEATIGYRVVPKSADGSASPLAFTGSQSLVGGQDQVDEVYTMGPVEINGAALDGVEDWLLDFGINLNIITADGHIYPTFVGVMNRTLSITIRTFDIEKFQSWGLGGTAQTGTDSTVKLLDQTEGGVRGTSPITFAIDAGMAHVDSIDGPQGQRIGSSVKITPISDGVSDIIVVSGI